MIDPIASAALSFDINPIFMGFIDFANEPMRVNTSGSDLQFSGTGDVDIDGFAFSGISASVVDIGPVLNKSGGSETLEVTLTALQILDQDLLDDINNEENWQGREIRLWRIIRDSNNVKQGGIQHYYTGNMTSVVINARPDSQTIKVSVEGYFAAFTAASNRSYLDQERYDPGDLSARAAIALVNNSTGGSLIGGLSEGGGGAGGGNRGFSEGFFEQ